MHGRDLLSIHELAPDEIEKILRTALSLKRDGGGHDLLRGKTLAQVEDLFARFHELVTADPSRAAEVAPELGKLAVFAGVHEFPLRVKCASLPWHTMKAALEGGAKATTE